MRSKVLHKRPMTARIPPPSAAAATGTAVAGAKAWELLDEAEDAGVLPAVGRPWWVAPPAAAEDDCTLFTAWDRLERAEVMCDAAEPRKDEFELAK